MYILYLKLVKYIFLFLVILLLIGECVEFVGLILLEVGDDIEGEFLRG